MGLRDERERVIGSEAAEGHRGKLEAERRHIPDADQGTHESRFQPANRKRQERCKNKTAGTRSNAIPIVKSTGPFAHDRLDAKMVNPAATISRPKRPGRRHHATSPANTYPSTIHTIRRA